MALDFPIAKSSNPALANNPFSRVRAISSDDVMTVEGTANKTILALGITLVAGTYSWSHPEAAAFFFPSMIVTLFVAIALIFRQNLAPVLTPVYAVAEGTMLGTISRNFEAAYHGVVSQAIFLTLSVMAAMLLAYRSQLIVVTARLRMAIVAATGGICLFYLGVMLMSLFHVDVSFMASASPLSIGVSLVVVGLAALNLVLDFDFIERAARSGGAPKYMEWYGAFALLVTLVWLYVELLRLLTKLQSARD